MALVERVCRTEAVYDLQVEGTRCFFANGVLVHNCIILDDPLSADDANSDAHRAAAEVTFTEALPTRVNNDRSAIVVIMQRLHEEDTSGIILSRDLGYTHLCLPMRFEADRRCVTPFYSDPRSTDGELLFPDRFPEDQVAALERTMGSYATAGQLQQRPSPRGGGMFKREWFAVIPAAPAGCTWVRGWDLAATADAGAARTAGCLMGRAPDGSFVIADMVKVQAGPSDVQRLIINTAAQDGHDVRGSIPQDPGQAGKVQAHDLIRRLAGYSYKASPESGDKVTRAMPLAAQAEVGNVSIVQGEWNRDFLDEMSGFPMAKFKDQVDAATRAFAELLEPAPAVAMFLRQKHRR